MQKHYFSPDGNFGDASGLVVVQTPAWTKQDWDEMEDVHESERSTKAEEIASRYERDEEIMQKHYTLDELQVCYNTGDLVAMMNGLLLDGYTGLGLGLIIDLIRRDCEPTR